LVHSDLNPTNFHVNDGQLTLFDFDDCTYNWLINEIAIALPLYSGIFTHKDLEDQMTMFFQWYMWGILKKTICVGVAGIPSSQFAATEHHHIDSLPQIECAKIAIPLVPRTSA
jgi:hypothetical protein